MLESTQLEQLKSAPVDPRIGNRVALAIKLAGLTQTKVAESVGMTIPHLSDICRGRYRTVRLDTAQKLAAFLGCSSDDIFPSQGVAA